MPFLPIFGTAAPAAAPSVAALFPGQAPVAARAGASAYALVVPPVPADAGFVGVRGGSRRTGSVYHPTPDLELFAVNVRSPLDAGIVLQEPVVAGKMSVGVAGTYRAAVTAYRTQTSNTPLDAGAGFVGVRGGPRRIGSVYHPTPDLELFAVNVRSPLDAGVSLVPPVLPPLLPSRSPGAIRSASLYAAALGGVVPTDYWPPVDTFTDATGTALVSHVPDTGGAWVLDASGSDGNGVITNANRVRQNLNGGLYYHSAIPPTADYDVAADFTCFSNPAFDRPGVAGRIQTGANSYYVARYFVGNGIQLVKVLGGSATTLGTYSRALNVGETVRITLRMNGSAISMMVDGVLRVGPVTDTAITAAGFAGLRLVASTADTDSTGTHVDNFNALWSDPPIGVTMPDRVFRATPSTWMPPVTPPLDVVAVANPNVFPVMPGAARGTARTAGSAYSLLASATPRDAGTEPTSILLPDRASAPRLRLANYAVFDIGPVDAGLAQPIVDPVMPDMAPGRARAAASAYTTLTSAPPVDAGTLPAWLTLPDRASAPRRAANAAYQVELFATPVDAGTQPTSSYVTAAAPGRFNRAGFDLIVQAPHDSGVVLGEPVPLTWMPERARTRPAQTYYSLVVAAPRDAGLVQPVIDPYMPDLAAPARRAVASAYTITTVAPLDIVIVAPVVEPAFPDRAPTALRTARQAYAVAVQSPADAGTLPTSEYVTASAPSRFNRAALELLVQAPHDAGVVLGEPIPLTWMPDRARSRPAQAFYSLLVAAPGDAGLAQPVIDPYTPDLATPARRTAAIAYMITTAAPLDIVIVAPVVEPALPDRAPTSQRTARLAYTVAVSSPRDAGTEPTSMFVPGSAPGPRLAANAAYQSELFATPRDGGLLPMPMVLPDRGAGPSRAANAAYLSELFATPRDAGTQPAAVIVPDRAVAPARAAVQGYTALASASPRDAGAQPTPVLISRPLQIPRRTAGLAYAITTPSPVDFGVLFVQWSAFPDPNATQSIASTDPFAAADSAGAQPVASVDPFAAADQFATKQIVTSDFAGVDAQKVNKP